MKRIIALLLASIMVLSMVACGNTEEKKEEAKSVNNKFNSKVKKVKF